MVDSEEDISWRAKLHALSSVFRYRPSFASSIVILGVFVALLEGVGLSFIYPIMEVGQSQGSVEATDPIMEAFLSVYEILGIPFSLGYLIVGIGIVMSIRFTSSFLVDWLRAVLQMRYEEWMRTKAFEASLGADVGYFDQEGSDDIINSIITQTRYSGRVIGNSVNVLQTSFLAMVYLAIMIYIAPVMTLYAIFLLGGITYFLRYMIEPGYTVGTRVAEANEQVQRRVQAGTQGIRDVKLFGLSDEIFNDFKRAVSKYARSSIELKRNSAVLQNGYNLAAALSLFVLIYIGFALSGLSLGALGIFLFAMFRLSPLASRLNNNVYSLEGNLSHLVRTNSFIDRIKDHEEDDGSQLASQVRHLEFDNVWFAYNDEETVLNGISFEVEKGEFVAFVGQSGAGKSSIISLLGRFYEPDTGEIRADGTSIDDFSPKSWRSRIAVVRQQPYIFNTSLRSNITVGDRGASSQDIQRVCEIAKVDEFVDDLPNGYDTRLGDDGVRLSGGQRQRVAIARALLKDADFLVLDEATSDLDSRLEQEVQRSIENMERNYAVIAIAHRLSTVRNTDRIYTVEDGRITEVGQHQELLENGGKYAELHMIQTEGH